MTLRKHLLALTLAGAAAMPALANQTIIYQIQTGNDDAEEAIADPDDMGAIDINSSDIELGQEKEKEKSKQLVGLRFTNIDLPKGAKVLSAYLQFTVDEKKNDLPFNVNIYAEATDNAAEFTTANSNLSNREKSAVSVNWSGIDVWEETPEHARGKLQQSPELNEVIQEIINRENWQAGNALAILIDGVGTRAAESYEGSVRHTGLNDLAAQLIITVPSKEEYSILGDNDDAEEKLTGGLVDVGSSDLELGWEKNNANEAQVVGIRFQDVKIPKGAEILSASLQFGQDEAKNNNPFEVQIWGEKTGDAKAYKETPNNISSRAKTSAEVVWKDVPDWTKKHETGPNQQTPDLSSIIQELVNQSDWDEGNSLAFLIEGKGTRTAESFDGASKYSPKLRVSFIGEQKSASIDKLRLSWTQDPSSTISILWNQLRGSNAKVYYAKYNGSDCPQDIAEYENSAAPVRIKDFRDMMNAVVRLEGLEPDTAYRFLVHDSEQTNECRWFRTAPNTPQPFVFISGGDTKSSGNALQAGRWSNQMVAKLRPLFVLFTGDFNSGNGTNAASWQQWLNDWSTMTTSEDGRMYPIIAVHGNHEDGDFENLYHLFDAGNNNPEESKQFAYYALSVGGDLLRIYNLNSQLYRNGKLIAHAKQNQWFESDLIANQTHTFKIAGYHKPMRPHTQSKSENNYLVRDWAPLFDKYDMSIAYESDTHNHVFTFPIRLAEDGERGDMDFVRDDDNGTLHVGEGSWGASPRDNNDDKSWTLDSNSINQIKLNYVYPATDGLPAKMEIRVIKTAAYVDGEFVNYVEAAQANDETSLFSIPAGVTVKDIPFYGDHISFPFKSVSGDAPMSPSDVTATATSYFDIKVSWVNQSGVEQVRNIQIERRREGETEWTLLDGSLNADTTMFEDKNLSDGTEYTYRLRATNIFGASEWSNEVVVSTPIDPRSSVEIREGLDGYTGSTVLAIASASPDNSFQAPELSIDQATGDFGGAGSSQGLIRFDNLLSSGVLPEDIIVDSAELRFYTTSSSNGPVKLYQVKQNWDETTSWNAFAGGIQADGTEVASTADDSNAGIGSGEYLYYDVTSSVKNWIAGEPNHGWAIINESTDGWDFSTDSNSNASERPMLKIYYSLVGDADGNGKVDRADLKVIMANLRKPADACPRCDLNGDGVISILDARKFVITKL